MTLSRTSPLKRAAARFGLAGPSRADRHAAQRLHLHALKAARAPVFYRTLDVEDTLEGRFEMIALHVSLLLMQLRSYGDEGEELAQALIDRTFDDFDANLREMGVGDLTVPKKIKPMATAFRGRLMAYAEAVSAQTEAERRAGLMAALRRNVWGLSDDSEEDPAGEAAALLADYVLATLNRWHNLSLEDIRQNPPAFAALPVEEPA